MSRYSRSYLAASIAAALLASYAHAEDTSTNKGQSMPPTDQCSVDTAQSSDSNQEPINIEANSLEAINGKRATYKGDVVVVQGNKTITADSVTLHQDENIVVAEGNVTLEDGQLKTVSDKITNNLNKDEITAENSTYKMLCGGGRGEAVYVSKTGKSMYQIEDGSITTCPEDDNSWRFLADDIKVDQEAEVATLYGSRVEVKDVPIFYMPYMSMPISGKRKTGVLFPSLSLGSKNGLELQVPVYWNLAPNYDLLTTFHYMQTRGLQLKGNLRYLTGTSNGTLDAEYLANDDKYPEYGDRWAVQYKNNSRFGEHWKLDLDYSQVSDNDYFQDLDSSVGSRSEGQLSQKGSLGYRDKYWDAALTVQDFQILVDDTKPYQLMPQFEFNYYRPDIYSTVNFDMVSHISRFETDDEDKPSATRVHVEPGFTLPLSNTWGTWTTEARYLLTHYQQDLDGRDPTIVADLDETVTRSLPEFRTHAGVVLERDTAFVKGYTQTLEPQIQYLYVPEVDQSNIYNYDTTLLQTDYYGLFRSRRYSGVDKIAAANQISYGATSRFYDDGQKERLAISFGQIYYLDVANKNPNTSNDDANSNYSSWAVETDFIYNDRISYHGGVQYDIDSSAVSLANSAIEYRIQDDFIQANYRYVTKEYIESVNSYTTDELDKLTRSGINQVGLMGGYQVNKNWIATGQYYYDMTEKVSVEWLAKLEYHSDCWYLGVDYSRQLRSWESGIVGIGGANFEDNVRLSFGITGLGGSSKAPEPPDGNALKYGRPFILND
ncbi:LPS assembly protein LptD [Vibrio sp. 10N.286.49.C2]|uniref:LPS assembly protein LptD n=1 Tax=unclassified Vibrio TaxID=2614977 RepID=UPI000C842503|nr:MULTISPECIES: LPS assembly protein LptD [unclassified Vibrio]PMH27579.1 LPS assembly protein LptD [Vibrio sp. 10N.286.49.C2]PMH53005.1 LPS assembly protein LptD [Vibrio sp. 10N.286.49.B1]PMH79228.1 LPS assembly protein LptD [Vibrio sp. 10N.286.48.B7]